MFAYFLSGSVVCILLAIMTGGIPMGLRTKKAIRPEIICGYKRLGRQLAFSTGIDFAQGADLRPRKRLTLVIQDPSRNDAPRYQSKQKFAQDLSWGETNLGSGVIWRFLAILLCHKPGAAYLQPVTPRVNALQFEPATHVCNH